MAFLNPKMYTLEEIYSLPDGQRAELIDGQLFMMAPPNLKHQEILSELHYQIKDYIKRKNGSCAVFPAPFAVFLNADDRNYVEPDLSVICDKAKLNEKGCSGAPDWVIEIVSPSASRMDYGVKRFQYCEGLKFMPDKAGRALVNRRGQRQPVWVHHSSKQTIQGRFFHFHIDFSHYL